jgi:hypothetical protein
MQLMGIASLHPSYALEKLRQHPPKKEREKLESDRILQELLILGRQQMRILSSPDELFGKEVLGLLMRLVHEPEGAAIRLAAKEKDLALALCARWSQLERQLRTQYSDPDTPNKTKVREAIERFSRYVSELQAILGGTATPDSMLRAFENKGIFG